MDRQSVHQRYSEIADRYRSGMTYSQIGKLFGVGSKVISAALRMHHVQARPRGGGRVSHLAPQRGRIWCDSQNRQCAISDLLGSCDECGRHHLRTASIVSTFEAMEVVR